MPNFRSLRYRLPFFIAIPLGVGVFALTVVAHSFAERALLDATRTRLADVSRQLSTSLETSVQRLDREMRRIATDSVLLKSLVARDSASLSRARAHLAIEQVKGTQPAALVLLSRDRQLVLRAGPMVSEFVDRFPPLAGAARADTVPAAISVTPFLRSDSGLTYIVAAPMVGSAGDTVGYVVAHKRVTANAASVTLLASLFGPKASLLLGNAAGNLWTNMLAVVPGPKPPFAPNVLTEFMSSAGERALAVGMPIRGSPWLVAIQVPRSFAVSAADRFRFQFASLALVIVAVGCAVAWWLSNQVTGPLAEVSHAAQAIADGDYGRRTSLLRHDELGTLASLFNVMAARVQDAAMSLEARNRALRESEVRYRLLVDRTPDAILVHRDGLVILANPAARALLGAESSEELLGAHVDALLPASATAAITGNSDPQASLTGWTEGHVQRKDGTTVTVERASFALQIDQSLAVLTILRNITERTLLEARLRQSQKMEAVGQLAGGVAHDFNNLLTVITSYSGVLLMEMAPDAPTRVEIQEIADAAERAGVLTRQLLAFSRQQVLQLQIIDVNDVVRDMEKLLSRLIPEHIRFVTKLEGNIGLVQADPGQLEQVIMNLVVNARDAMPGGGTVTIASTVARLNTQDADLHAGAEAGTYVVLSVSDTGLGMSAEQQTRIFEPFFTTKGPGHGTGLGLSTVYGIVKQSKGHIWVYSEVGHGTMFKVYLPQVDRPSDRRTPVQVMAHGARTGETVLLAEDGPQVRTAARQILERSGYVVLEAASARQAMDYLLRHPAPIHLLLTDMVMPEMSGRELATYCRQHRPEAAIVFMSGYTQDSDLLQSVMEPGTQFIQKPFTPPSLLGALRAALDEQRFA